MPKYVCDECGDVFQSKEERREHEHTAGSASSGLSLDLSIPDFTLKQFFVLGGVFLMATLFMGTAFFYSSSTPASPSGGNTASAEPSPPVGYTIRSQGDIPDVPSSNIPSSGISDSQFSQEAQLYLLTRPAVLLQYSCTNCPGTVDSLESVAEEYNAEQTWVYVAPYRDMDSRIAMTGFQQGPVRMEGFDRDQVESFICTALQNQPVRCALGG